MMIQSDGALYECDEETKHASQEIIEAVAEILYGKTTHAATLALTFMLGTLIEDSFKKRGTKILCLNDVFKGLVTQAFPKEGKCVVTVKFDE